jgi:hypothetical protein
MRRNHVAHLLLLLLLHESSSSSFIHSGNFAEGIWCVTADAAVYYVLHKLNYDSSRSGFFSASVHFFLSYGYEIQLFIWTCWNNSHIPHIPPKRKRSIKMVTFVLLFLLPPIKAAAAVAAVRARLPFVVNKYISVVKHATICTIFYHPIPWLQRQ